MKAKRFLLVIPILLAALITVRVMADYLGPDRTVTETRSVCKVSLYECANVNGTWKYKKTLETSCGEDKWWLAYPSQKQTCDANNASYEYYEKGDVITTVQSTYPPATIAGELLNCTLQNGWCNTRPRLSLTGDEPLDDYVITAIEGTRNGSAFSSPGSTYSISLVEGQNNFTFWALSSWGDSSLMGSLSAKVDTTPPQLQLAVDGVAGASGWYVSPVTVTANASDSLSGLASSSVSSGGSWRPSLTLADGAHTVSMSAVDVAGNSTTGSQTVRVDTLKPDIFISAAGTLDPSGWYTSSVELSATASDQTSGVDGSAQVSMDDGITWRSVVTLGSGLYPSILFRASDVAGNENTTTFSAKVDTDIPSISISENGRMGEAGWYISTATVTAIAADATSGVASLQQRVDGGAWVSGNATTVGDGIHAVEFQVLDLAGNMQIASRAMRVDNIAPSSAFSSSTGEAVFSGTVYLSGSTSDAGSGVASVEVSTDGSTWIPTLVTPSEWGLAWDTSKLPNGDHVLLVRARDVAGNTNYPASISVVLNNHPPLVSLSSLWPVTESGVLTFQADGTPLKSVQVEVESTGEMLVNICPSAGESRLSVAWPQGRAAAPGTYPVVATVCDIYNLCASARGAILVSAAPPIPSVEPNPVVPPIIEPPVIEPPVIEPPTIELPISDPPVIEPPAYELIQIDPFPDPLVPAPLPALVIWPLFCVASILLMYAFLLTSDPRPAALRSLERVIQPFVKENYP